ncbi:MAG: hypothetical protein WD532_04845 [Acidimicrobiia bacterium]
MRVEGLPNSTDVMAPPTWFPNPPTVTVDASLLREIDVDFTPLAGDEQLVAPPIGKRLDLEELGVPNDLPLTPGG